MEWEPILYVGIHPAGCPMQRGTRAPGHFICVDASTIAKGKRSNGARGFGHEASPMATHQHSISGFPKPFYVTTEAVTPGGEDCSVGSKNIQRTDRLLLSIAQEWGKQACTWSGCSPCCAEGLGRVPAECALPVWVACASLLPGKGQEMANFQKSSRAKTQWVWVSCLRLKYFTWASALSALFISPVRVKTQALGNQPDTRQHSMPEMTLRSPPPTPPTGKVLRSCCTW